MMTRREGASQPASDRVAPIASRIASAFDAPNAATTTIPASARTGSVIVSRRGGGFGASCTAMTGPTFGRCPSFATRLRRSTRRGRPRRRRRAPGRAAADRRQPTSARLMRGERPARARATRPACGECEPAARAPASATGAMRGRNSSRDGRAEPRARRSRTGRCAPNPRRVRREREGMSVATDPPGSATTNLPRLAMISAACAVNSAANAR